MEYRSMSVPYVTIGLDLGDKKSHLFALRHDGEVVADEGIPTTKKALTERFQEFPAARVVMEAGGQSQWISGLLSKLGHEVIVANPSVLGNKKQRRKNDRLDAEILARKGRADPKELRPIQHRSSAQQLDLSVIRARDCLVRTRTLLINSVRSLVKTHGQRLPSASSPAFAKKMLPLIPQELKAALNPLLSCIANLSSKIAVYDKQIQKLSERKYPHTTRLMQVGGVSFLTALAYVLTLEDARRFPKSRSAGAFVGLVPALEDSGNGTPQLRISRAGNAYLRRLLVSAAQYILGPFGKDCDLRRYGEAIARHGGKNGKKRAAVAVARKLSVLLHHLWISGDKYDPLYNAHRRQAA